MRRFLAFLFIGMQFFLAGCNGQLPIPQLQQPTETPEVIVTAILSTATSQVSNISPTPPGPATLKLWLPPEFYPTPGNAAGEMLQARVEEFMKLHPEIRIELREKSNAGLIHPERYKSYLKMRFGDELEDFIAATPAG